MNIILFLSLHYLIYINIEDKNERIAMVIKLYWFFIKGKAKRLPAWNNNSITSRKELNFQHLNKVYLAKQTWRNLFRKYLEKINWNKYSGKFYTRTLRKILSDSKDNHKRRYLLYISRTRRSYVKRWTMSHDTRGGTSFKLVCTLCSEWFIPIGPLCYLVYHATPAFGLRRLSVWSTRRT